jgi:hypothetical protein
VRLFLVAFMMLAGGVLVACDAGAGASITPTAEPTEAVAAATAVPPTPAPTDTPTPEPTATPIVAAELPIIDLHFHPTGAWGDGLVALLDRLNVRAVGGGAPVPDADALALAERYAPRVAPFGGGFHTKQFVLRLGAAAWNLENADVRAYLDALEADVAAGRFAGIGEVHVDSTASYFTGTPPVRYPADAPMIQRLWSMSAAYGVPLQVHMDGSPDSVASLERLLASDRAGTLLWAHTGHYAEPPLLRRLLQEHPNLCAELSYRGSVSRSYTAVPIDRGGVLREEWRALLEEFPGRFVVGTDISWVSSTEYERHIGYWRSVLGQLTPETAAMLAYRNAERLLAPGVPSASAP